MQTKIIATENKIFSVTEQVTTAAPYTKATDIEGEISDITNLDKKTALNIKATGLKAKYIRQQVLLLSLTLID